MRRLTSLTRAMFLMIVRNRSALFWNLAFPIFLLITYYVVWGNMDVAGVGFVQWIVPGVLVYNMLAFGLITSSQFMVDMREKGILRRLQASPVPAWQLLVGFLVVNIVVSVLQSVIVIVFSTVAFGFSVSAGGLIRLAPMLLVGLAVCMSMGQLVGSASPTLGAAIAIAQVVNFSQMFITDMVVPFEILPEWLQKVAQYLPAYAVVRLVRPPLLEGTMDPDLWRNLLVAAIYMLVCGGAAARLFRWSPRR